MRTATFFKGIGDESEVEVYLGGGEDEEKPVSIVFKEGDDDGAIIHISEIDNLIDHLRRLKIKAQSAPEGE